jgi:hypothetical protein
MRSRVLAIEVGYELAVGPVVLRPTIALGLVLRRAQRHWPAALISPKPRPYRLLARAKLICAREQASEGNPVVREV